MKPNPSAIRCIITGKWLKPVVARFISLCQSIGMDKTSPKRIRTYLLQWLAILLVLIPCLANAQATFSSEANGGAWLLTIKGAIGPAAADYVSRGIDEAVSHQASIIILQLDTPGGLDAAMRDIVHAILKSPVPVVGYVSPEGARAASAGTYILYACNVAAMAPATNLGAATPVQIGGDNSPVQQPTGPSGSDGEGKGTSPAEPLSHLQKKIINDAVAYIRSLAELRGRNADWAEQAVREGVSLSASAALKQKVVDLIAPDLEKLLQQLDGRQIDMNGTTVTLNTTNLKVHRIDPDWRSEFMSVIANPNLAYILLLAGIAGLVIEFTYPGGFAPGIIGAICLLLAFYAFQLLPVNYVGLLLIVLGIGLMIGEALNPSFGALGIGGLTSFIVGSVMLMDSDLPGYHVAYPLIGGVAAAAGLLLIVALNMAIRSHRRATVIGNESWVGKSVIAVEDFQGKGHVRVDGELWRAISETPVQKGETLHILAVEGLTLHVGKQETTS